MKVRKLVVRASHLDDSVELGTVTRQAADFLEAAVVAGSNILVAGATQAGNPIHRKHNPTTGPTCVGRCSAHRGRGPARSGRASSKAVSTSSTKSSMCVITSRAKVTMSRFSE